MKQIFRLLKCGCYALKLPPICKQLQGNGLPLTITSATINLKIIDLIRIMLQHGECAHSEGLHVVTRLTFFFFSRVWSVPLSACDQEKQHAAQKRSSKASFGGHRNQPPTIVISSHPKPVLRYGLQYNTCAIEIFIFLTHLTIGFQNGTFVYMFHSLNVSSVSMLEIYIQNGLLTQRIESSSTRFWTHTITLYSCCSLVEWHCILHRHFE